jgi:hypothetical protein
VKFAAKQRFEGSYLPPSGQEAARWIASLKGKDRPTAVFFGNYLMAMAPLPSFTIRVSASLTTSPSSFSAIFHNSNMSVRA